MSEEGNRNQPPTLQTLAAKVVAKCLDDEGDINKLPIPQTCKSLIDYEYYCIRETDENDSEDDSEDEEANKVIEEYFQQSDRFTDLRRRIRSLTNGKSIRRVLARLIIIMNSTR